MKVRMLIGYKVSGTLVIPKDELLEIREFDAPLFGKKYQVIEGQFSGIIVPEQYFIRISEERSYCAAEYRKLETELKIAKEDEQEAVRKYGEAEQKNDRLAGNVVKLTSEVRQYRSEIERLRALVDEKAKDERRMFEESERLKAQLEAKKVVIPMEVAEAIKYGMTDLGWSAQNMLVKSIRCDWESTEMSPLKRFVKSSDANAMKLALAIMHGYTVEQTKEERLRDGIEKVVTDWGRKPGAPKREQIKDLAHYVTDFVTKFNAQNE